MAEALVAVSSVVAPLIKVIHLNKKLKKRELIRELLYDYKLTKPDYNVVIYSVKYGFDRNGNDSFVDKIFDEVREYEDLFRKFKIRILVFKSGSITIHCDINNGKKWGILLIAFENLGF